MSLKSQSQKLTSIVTKKPSQLITVNFNIFYKRVVIVANVRHSCGSSEQLHHKYAASCFDAHICVALLAEEEAGIKIPGGSPAPP
ncbi:hypothetical protein EBO34_17880 [Alteribacter keqinensis]|uniref:Uncharacterized protein n=1 Tax=Alteribacter keqinensis TaxID=2483800 RepID=A0A3M7TRY5_9BACI|nr:hypothetical protein EBO34_17880 [Alteribacter keqinensis]